MFEPDLDDWPWAAALLAAAPRGQDAVALAARRLRAELGDEEADEVGLLLCGLLELALDPPGHFGTLATAARFFAGPRSIAALGRALRARDVAAWKADVGLGVLERNPGVPALIQLTLGARDGDDVELLPRFGRMLRGYPHALRELLTHAGADVPPADLERYFAIMLEQAMIQGTRFSAAQLRDVVRSPMHQAFARVVWAEYRGRSVTQLFGLDPESDDLVDADWSTIVLADDALVGVVHPAEAALDAWGLTLAETGRAGLFPQLDRACAPAQPHFPYRTIDRDVPHWDLVRFLFRNGWTRDRESRDFELPIRAATLVLSTRIGDAEMRRLVSIHLRSGDFGRGIEDDVTYSEALAATLGLLEEFAPELI